MTKFLQIGFILIALFFAWLPLQAVNKPSGDDCIMANPVFSFIGPETVSASMLVTTDDDKFTLYISEGILYIKYSKPQELVNGEVIIYNLLGKEVTRKKLENNNVNEINVPVQNTCYIVKLNYSGKVYTQKVIPSN